MRRSMVSASTSSSTAPERPRPGRCPFCDVLVKRYVSGTQLNPGRPYYKCPNYNLIPRCRFYVWEDKYVSYPSGTGDVNSVEVNHVQHDGGTENHLEELVELFKKKCHADHQIKVLMIAILIVMIGQLLLAML